MKENIVPRVILVCLWCVLVHGQRDSPLIQFAFNRAASRQSEERFIAQAGFANNIPTVSDTLMFAIHNDGPESSAVAEKANFVNDLALFLNARSVTDMTFDTFDELTDRINERVDGVCPANLLTADCSTLDLTFRPINNLCNNLDRPLLGMSNIAQRRLARAFWENSALVETRISRPGFLRPLNPLGIRLLGAFVFHLAGSVGFKLSVLNPEQGCFDRFVAAGSSVSVSGVITSASPVGATASLFCVEDDTYSFDGNELEVTGGCSGTFTICTQSEHIEVNLPRLQGESCALKVNGVVKATFLNKFNLYPTNEARPQPFWLTIKDGNILVGRGSDCDEKSAIMGAKTPILNLFTKLRLLRFSVAISVLSSGTMLTQSPVRDSADEFLYNIMDMLTGDSIELETTRRGSRSLENFPFLFSRGNLRWGFRPSFFNTYAIVVYDDTNNAYVALVLGQNSFIKYVENGVIKDVLFINELFIQFISFVDGAEESHNDFGAYWLSWTQNTVYAGVGNVVGKKAIAPAFNLPITGFEFTAERVVLSSNRRASWIFDLVQFGVPRQRSFTGNPLPTPRDVSLTVHSNINQPTIWSPILTMALMNFGQFVDHDIVATPTEEVEGSDPIMCCVDGKPLPENEQSEFCFNINITDRTDPFGSQGAFPFPEFECIPLVRSAATIECNGDRDLRSREQANSVTSFVDGSNIYGSEPEAAKSLREGAFFDGARLATSLGGREPPTTENPAEECRPDQPDFQCFEAGDFRVSEQVGLTSVHSLWVREHNRVVNELVKLFGLPETTVDDREFLYQSARRIVVAEYQNIVYDGYLEAFLDKDIFNFFRLGFGQCTYDPTLDPTTINEWGIANRMGHTWINPNVNGTMINLVEHFFNPSLVHTDSSDFLIRNLFETTCPFTDRVLETVITEDLFRDGVNGPDALDLASLNIQRGRDHGVSYCRLREALNLPIPASFDEAAKIGLFPLETIKLLESSYECVCDIDLFTGIVSETPLNLKIPGSTSPNGETLNHIEGAFFGNAKCGDRYWFEFPDAGFTPEQIAAISEVTLSRVICENTADVTTLQVDAFNVESSINPRVPCSDTSSIPKLDLSLFAPTVARRGMESDKLYTQPKAVADDESGLESKLDAELQELLRMLNEKNNK